MYKKQLLTSFTAAAVITLTACSDSNDPATDLTNSQFNPNAEQSLDDGKSGGDTTAIAGLWDGTITDGDTSNVVYWNMAENGVLTRYDYQQDGAPAASGENCYAIGDPISVAPENGDSYSFFNVSTTTVVNADTLTITFIDADSNDLDKDGDTAEIPTLTWTSLTTPSIEDLNSCTVEDETTLPAEVADQPDPPIDEDVPSVAITDPAPDLTVTDPIPDGAITDPIEGEGTVIPVDIEADLPEITIEACEAAGGRGFGDAGDGGIFKPEYRCDSGMAPIGRIPYVHVEGQPRPTEPGSVCCL